MVEVRGSAATTSSAQRNASVTVDAAVERYHSLLVEAHLDDGFFADFVNQLKNAGITFGDRVSCHYLRPQLVTAAQYEQIRRVVRTLWGALEKLGDEMLKKPELQDRVGLTPIEKDLAAIDPGYDRISPMARFDSFLTAGGISFVELNAECPAGPAYVESLAEVFLALPTMREFREFFSLQAFQTRRRLKETLLATWREWSSKKRSRPSPGGPGPNSLPSIAIVDYRGLPTAAEFELCREYFQSQGIAAAVADPRELTYDGRRLRTKDGMEIDLVYRRVLTNEFIDHLAEVQPMLNAYRDGAVCLVNPFRSKLLHKKMIFGLLTAEELQHLFTPAEQEAIAAHIPWTRRLAAGSTVYENQEIDLVPWTKANREILVLKPNDEYGGKGIHVGWTMDDASWQAAVDEALALDYLVQRKVEVAYAEFPTIAKGTLRFERQLVDLDPYVFEGEVEGILTRLSGTALANVTAGAGIVPTFVAEPAEVGAGR